MSAKVTVIIPNWNNQEQLKACLQSLRLSTFQGFETIVVDNGSQDESVSMVRNSFPAVKLIALEENLGFAAACNIGIRAVQSEYVALLNNDTEVETDWLERILSALDEQPEAGFAASKILMWSDPQRVDACGDLYTIEGMAVKIGHLESAANFNTPQEVFGASAAAVLYRKSMLDDIGFFDEDFHMIHEDSDLSFRAQLKGYKCIFVPGAVVLHHVSATLRHDRAAASYLHQRNLEFVYLKNMPTWLLLRYLPLHCLANSMLSLEYLRRGQLRIFLKAKSDSIKLIPQMLGKRREIQRDRRVSADELEGLLSRGWLWEKVRLKVLGRPGS